MIKKSSIKYVFAVATCLFVSHGYAATNSTVHTYPSGVSMAVQIGSDLYDSLDAKYRKKLLAKPISTEASDAPQVTLARAKEEKSAQRQISISVGFVDLMNHIAHAKAVDRLEPGYFDAYMLGLSRQTDSVNKVTAPAISEERYWTDEVMNDQTSYFNQMMGMTIAINLSHHYLGRSEKYAGQLQGDHCVPINNYLTPSEWESSVRAGAVNSLNCAFGTEGEKALFAAIDKMSQRPAWTAYIVPQNIDIKKLNKQLAKYEVDFFHGQLN